MTSRVWLPIAGLFLCVALVFAFFTCTKVHARGLYAQSATSDWYKAQRNGKGGFKVVLGLLARRFEEGVLYFLGNYGDIGWVQLRHTAVSFREKDEKDYLRAIRYCTLCDHKIEQCMGLVKAGDMLEAQAGLRARRDIREVCGACGLLGLEAEENAGEVGFETFIDQVYGCELCS